MPRYITVPEPVTLVDPITDESFKVDVTFKEFVCKCLMADARWVSSFKYIEAAQEVLAAIKSGESLLMLDKDTWEKLKTIADAPQGGYAHYHGSVLPQLISFIKAILDASEKNLKAVESPKA